MNDEIDEELERAVDALAEAQACRRFPEVDDRTLLAKRDEIKSAIWKKLAELGKKHS